MGKNGGISKLAKVIQGRVKEKINEKGNIVEFATILKNLSLRPDTFDVEISKNEYLIIQNSSNVLKAGDRVVIAWFDNEAIVLGKFVEGTEMIENV